LTRGLTLGTCLLGYGPPVGKSADPVAMAEQLLARMAEIVAGMRQSCALLRCQADILAEHHLKTQAAALLEVAERREADLARYETKLRRASQEP
jgi:hypothetical protein